MPASTTFDEGSWSDGLTSAEIDLLRLRAARYARKPEAAVEKVTHAVVFRKGATRYAAPIGCLREIRPLPALCRIPGASRCVPGVFHVRGEILSAHALDAFMGQDAGEGPSPWVLLIEHDRERLGLMADEVIDITAVTAKEVMPVPITFGERASCFQGILSGGALLLQPIKLFSTSSFFAAF